MRCRVVNHNTSPDKKIELLERQKDILSNIKIDDDAKENARIFKSDAVFLLINFFGQNNKFANDLSQLRFDTHKSIKRGQSNTFTRVFSEEPFKASAKTAHAILDSAISNIKLQQELAESQGKSKIISREKPREKNKVFIVHGHDDGLKNEVARFVERQNLSAIILHEQTSRGQTIIEKIEANADVDFAIVLYTPCDVGKAVGETEEKSRARQNVIFEHGYFVAKLGRSNVVALNKGNVEIPNDLSGIVYTPYDEYGYWKRSIAHELKESGYKIDFSKI